MGARRLAAFTLNKHAQHLKSVRVKPSEAAAVAPVCDQQELVLVKPAAARTGDNEGQSSPRFKSTRKASLSRKTMRPTKSHADATPFDPRRIHASKTSDAGQVVYV